MHHIVLWKWKPRVPSARATYTAEHVNIVAGMVHRAMAEQGLEYRVICITDDPTGIQPDLAMPYALWRDGADLTNASGDHLPSCYRRLRLYDPATQEGLHIPKGDRIVSLDLDCVITGPLGDVLREPAAFVGWELKGTVHDRVFNGSFQMFTAGDLAFLWKSFNPASSPALASAAGYMGSDQAWLSLQLCPFLADRLVTGLKWPQVVSYPLQARLQGLQVDNRLIFFHGQAKPWMEEPQRTTPWITDFWRLPE